MTAFTVFPLVLASVFNSMLERERVLTAIEQVESGGRGFSTPDGDNGKAIGPFQIHKIYWEDAVAKRPDLKSRGYEECHDPVYAREVVRCYLTRYHADTPEKMARIHNGGPKGATKKATIPYWNKVKVQL